MTNNLERAIIVPGSRAEFWVDLQDEVTGRGVNLSTYTDPKAIFCNCKGERIVVPLTITAADATCGSIQIQIPASETIKFDQRSMDFDLEFTDGTDVVVFPVDRMIELRKRNCPPSS